MSYVSWLSFSSIQVNSKIVNLQTVLSKPDVIIETKNRTLEEMEILFGGEGAAEIEKVANRKFEEANPTVEQTKTEIENKSVENIA